MLFNFREVAGNAVAEKAVADVGANGVDGISEVVGVVIAVIAETSALLVFSSATRTAITVFNP